MRARNACARSGRGTARQVRCVRIRVHYSGDALICLGLAEVDASVRRVCEYVTAHRLLGVCNEGCASAWIGHHLVGEEHGQVELLRQHPEPVERLAHALLALGELASTDELLPVAGRKERTHHMGDAVTHDGAEGQATRTIR